MTDFSSKLKDFKKNILDALEVNMVRELAVEEQIKKKVPIEYEVENLTSEQSIREGFFAKQAVQPQVIFDMHDAVKSDDKPVNLLLDEDGISTNKISGWRRTFESTTMLYRTTKNFQCITSVKILTIKPIRKFITK